MRLAFAFVAALFALFPLTDTDIWWHLACGREWLVGWTPVREPIVNVHEYFQQFVYAVYGVGGAPLLVALKCLLWGCVFALFCFPSFNKICVSKVRWAVCFSVVSLILFLFRYQMELRPVVFSLLFLGIYWNVLPKIFWQDLPKGKWITAIVGVFFLQWIWCRFQGLYILGPLFACAICIMGKREFWKRNFFVVAVLLITPLLHRDGILLAAYPFELLNRLLGMSPSASIFASQVAENRSPLTLLLEGENLWTSLLMLLCSLGGASWALLLSWRLIREGSVLCNRRMLASVTLLTTAVLALVAERNFILFLPVLIYNVTNENDFVLQESWLKKILPLGLVLVMFIVGLWCKSLQEYDRSMIAFQRVPVAAAEWMKLHPHQGRLFNDDRAGGYLAFVNPADPVYIDGRFMLKTADFFERYLDFARSPDDFVVYADSAGIDRAVFPLRYYARWNQVIENLVENPQWRLAYRDDHFCVFQK